MNPNGSAIFLVSGCKLAILFNIFQTKVTFQQNEN